MEKEIVGLCYRCEYRALSLEKKRQPRCECGMHSMAVCSCYMYKPVKPIITQISPGYEKRPRLIMPMICAREMGVGVAEDVELHVEQVNKKKLYLYWTPKKERKHGKNKRKRI